MRQALLLGLPLLAPVLAYLLWFALARRSALAAGREPPLLGDAPWMWLVGGGVLLAGSLLGGLAIMDGAPPGGRYQPPRTVDGVVEPARIRP